MTPFAYHRAGSTAEALELARNGAARFLGGGTNLVDLMRQNVEAHSEIVDVSKLPAAIVETEGGGLRIDAAVRNGDLAAHPVVRTRYPVLARALLTGASAQIRNMATVGGNILQRTRCTYFYDVEGARCNKRRPSDGCGARGGFNRYHAILGGSASCIAVHPSDMCVALAALDATVWLRGANGERSMPLTAFHRLPGDRPDLETVLETGELITGVELAPVSEAARSTYRKVRDRSSYAFALVSVAAVLKVDDGRVTEARIALGGVAPKPWRARRAEAALIGQQASTASFQAAAEAELEASEPLPGNAFKVELAKRTITAVLGDLLETRA